VGQEVITAHSIILQGPQVATHFSTGSKWINAGSVKKT
jgi:hypothetical protein